MTETPDPDRLKKLEERIRAAQKAQEPAPPVENVVTNAAMAWRMVVEMVVGVAIGFGIGYGLDSLFGTLPVFLVLFVLAGFVAGVRTMLRSVQEIQKGHAGRASGPAAGDKPDPQGTEKNEGDRGGDRNS